jgi:hypothetical protein
MKFFTKMMDAFHIPSFFFGAALAASVFAYFDYGRTGPQLKAREELYNLFSSQMDTRFAVKLADCMSRPIIEASVGCQVDKDNFLVSTEKCINSDELRVLEANQALQICILKIKNGRL